MGHKWNPIPYIVHYHKALVKSSVLPPGWHSGLRHCIAALAVPPETLCSSPGSVAAGRDREVRGATHNRPSVTREGLACRDILVSSLSYPCLIAHQRLLWRAGRSAR